MKHRLLPLLLSLILISCAHPERVRPQPERISPAWGDAIKIDPTKPPSGMHMVQILLENQSLSVKGTNCESDPFGVGDKRRLQHKLAMTLGYAFDRPHHHAVLSGSCEADQFEPPSGLAIDIWRCNLAVVEKDEKDEFIASSNIYFGIKRGTWEFIPEKLLCT